MTQPEKFVFTPARQLKEKFDELGLTKGVMLSLRKKLPEGVYWIQPDRQVMWNTRLLFDLILKGDDTDHRILVKEYCDTLPYAEGHYYEIQAKFEQVVEALDARKRSQRCSTDLDPYSDLTT